MKTFDIMCKYCIVWKTHIDEKLEHFRLLTRRAGPIFEKEVARFTKLQLRADAQTERCRAKFLIRRFNATSTLSPFLPVCVSNIVAGYI